jgi:hypothetical protein
MMVLKHDQEMVKNAWAGFAWEGEWRKWEGVRLFLATSEKMTMFLHVFTLCSENIEARELVE